MTTDTAAPAPAPHVCDAQCWAEMIRYGCPTECDPFAARAAADEAAS